MRSEVGTTIRLSEYAPPSYLVSAVSLTFRLYPRRTIVKAALSVQLNLGTVPGTELVFDGDGIELLSLTLNGLPVDATTTPEELRIAGVPHEPFTLEIETAIDPEANLALSGLYRSNGVYCTQCEAEGFRRITYFPDRPDVLSVYTVRIEALSSEAPVLLSNGNPGEAGELPDGWHFAEWHDPWPKPSYLFALVAGDIVGAFDRFTTMSGREVELGVYVERGKESRTGWAIESLKRSMKWDEEVFGREYDLDVFNIVAVSDFNMGAMENKGLNIFNDKYILADFRTATDTDYANIETIIAHEYFHNWTGNRITCRDWFQLCLKEGLTVYRDHEFSADMRSRAVRRIAEVRTLKSAQFPEDGGPLAHPVRPTAYREINNFYTATVYEKGSEVIRMLRMVIGDSAFRVGMDRYFGRHDGDAATIEDFLACFEEASGRSLAQFALWYHQAGTPQITAETQYDKDNERLVLTLDQFVPPTPDQTDKKPMHIPIAFALFRPDGAHFSVSKQSDLVQDGIIHLTEQRSEVVFDGIDEQPVVSLLRGFSAPVTLDIGQPEADRIFLARHEDDLYTRWQALDRLATDTILASYRQSGGRELAGSADALIALYGEVACDEGQDAAWRALTLTLPGEATLGREAGLNVDPDAIHDAREALLSAIAESHASDFAEIYGALGTNEPYSPDALSAGRRALKLVLLDYLTVAEGGAARGKDLFDRADNMTEEAGALENLILRRPQSTEAKAARAAFEARHGDDPLVMDKLLGMIARVPGGDAPTRILEAMEHPNYVETNPNRVRALIASFAGANPSGFHRPDGSGYRILADVIARVAPQNPQLGARLATHFRSWKGLETTRRAAAYEVLQSLRNKPDLPLDVRDIIDRTLS
ncbi:aminopeptidase N [Notoacmeibacter sp. MSK16QG-6]|uniref:aminopeptidase N n=1 Tax=Notoacmeibacter sp. MSK16QG-6 TaxID=2957982 RepID=UPI00209F5F50|nr:aminopeptidase N [Notoacmeibacter sp. MSK16QG-6]MCP1198108.1 aminopeptidase N [Notoacmeibacter sp. MSK16QG-6]